MCSGLVAWPVREADRVLRFMRDFIEEAPDEVGLMANLRIAPALPFVPTGLVGEPIIAVVACYVGSVPDGEVALRPIRALGSPSIDTVGPHPYVAHQRIVDASVPHGNHYYWKAAKLPRLTDELIATITRHAEELPTPHSAIPIFCQGGAVARVAEDATAFPSRDARHDINMLASWSPGDPNGARHREWARAFHDAVAPHAAGVYVNFVSDEKDDVLTSVYGEEKLARLRSIKRTYDPANVFHYNANIAPG
ncbi:MAG: BBE domain-containing protein [Actinomycetota bacterium]|nr:BBE domain-containing protein [Actinomycetota bacterium]